ncbi:DUF4135 domain-containing protein [Streptomyces sp. KL116D]|uniref:DUF4135 domain-containing protein n=1 Tax=Streptomyces sp. KL116D TaxID=3045152 RepID=UPI0035570FE5
MVSGAQRRPGRGTPARGDPRRPIRRLRPAARRVPRPRASSGPNTPFSQRHLGDILTLSSPGPSSPSGSCRPRRARHPVRDGGLGDLVDVQPVRAGDTHRRGRSVAIVTFTRKKLVCKLPGLASDVAWGEVLSWFHGQDPDYDLVAPRTLAGEGYGGPASWTTSPCRSDGRQLRAPGFFWRTARCFLPRNTSLCAASTSTTKTSSRTAPILW